VGAELGFAPREEIVQRMLRITHFLAHADRYHGAWPHFLSGSTGKILRNFGEYDDGADLVETSFLVEGLLAARGYFTRDTPEERRLRDEISALWQGVEWDWFRATPKRDALYWHWSPDFAFHIANRLRGWNEVMITYMLAIASPTHPAPPGIYYTGWAAEGDPTRKFGEEHSYYGIPVWMNSGGSPGPLFFTHYSFMGYDPRGMRDKFADYFVNNQNTSLVQQKYAIENPMHFKDYGADSWGLSAVTGPHGYREYKPFTQDDGTLAPTAAMGAYAYTPGPSLAALKHFYRDLGAQVWDVYGFRNAFNVTEDWYSPDELALNQGPQTVMIENGRTGLVWRSFMSNPEISAMQKAVGFVGDTK
jgi:exo beta-1,2-glucooligosaccharide sophorohydrolase (non-reducing end)